ncbi:formylglycine-generating enzyme family protein [Microbacterium sp. APC 3898]|uniref:Formylglycine-generating enzyme family protein n=1 Tax=Planococcus notacanthi TaxID=3035188 RepID=A0ABT7ZMV1_9BACL|nr:MULTISPECIES: formylglycine-generating enzyme family protein [Terrabacteria group]MDN3428471.1 formylglycine-generating enzyme family protein [Planococcus sp. APC 4016]MDN3498822.1 formylglycine-generating enzyme family protein [Microbacterium sp. APC 3898]
MQAEQAKSCCAAKRMAVEKNSNQKTEDIEVPSMTGKTVSKEDMAFIPGGQFLMGTEDTDGFPADGEGPIHKVSLKPFYMDKYAVSNQDFKEFVEDTAYVTEAERYGWSFVFHLFLPEAILKKISQKVQQTPWWIVVEGANWRSPEGPGTGIEYRLDHPVIQISWNDAKAYCKWANKRLPTEAEWEFAARGGIEQKKYVWGDELTPEGKHRCNIWQGDFPKSNTAEDGYSGTAPVSSYEPNGYGLFNMSGNVWEWCSDWFVKNVNKRGGRYNPTGPDKGLEKVMRGGSYLCHESYCNRYRVAARTSNTPDSSTGNIGFRCVTEA